MQRPTRSLTTSFLMVIPLVYLGCGMGHLRAQTGAPPEDWIPLFNGHDLQGWDIKIAGQALNHNHRRMFGAENGVLRISLDEYHEFDGTVGHLFYRKKFSHYLLALEYRFVGDPLPGGPDWLSPINSGVMIHSQSARSMGIDQGFPVSLEVQLRGAAGSEKTPTANLCPLGTVVEMGGQDVTEDCIPSTSGTYQGSRWVRLIIRVLGASRIEHIVEGDTVMAYRKPRILQDERNHFDPSAPKDETVLEDSTLLEEGYIALQGENHGIEFRKVELLNLAGCTDPRAANYRAYFVRSDDRQCRYRTAPTP